MINKNQVLYLLVFVLCAFPALESYGQDSDGADEMKATLDKFYGLDIESRGMPTDGRYISIDICAGRFTIDYIYPIGEPHLKYEEQFYVIGPLGVFDVFFVWPLSASSTSWDHSWEPGMYIGSKSLVYTGWYTLKPVGVSPHGMDPTRDHEYIMRPSRPNSRGCPTYIEFHSLYHVDEGPIKHPGHAGAEIG